MDGNSVSDTPAKYLRSMMLRYLPQSLYRRDFSTIYFQCLSSAVISQVLYVRKILPSDNFTCAKWRDYPLNILKFDETLNESIKTIAEWLSVVFEGIEERYVQSFTLEIYEETGTRLLETYTIHLTHSKDAESLLREDLTDFFTPERDRDEVNEMDSSVVEMFKYFEFMIKQEARPELPNTVALSINISYDLQVTPSAYMPDSFMDTTEEKPIFQNKCESIRISEIKSEYHSLKFSVKIPDNPDFQATGTGSVDLFESSRSTKNSTE